MKKRTEVALVTQATRGLLLGPWREANPVNGMCSPPGFGRTNDPPFCPG